MKNRAALVAILLACSAVVIPLRAAGETKELKTGGFQVQQELILPASPEAVYDAMTGDISGWCDHSFSQRPNRLFIEPKPGGGFWEIFDDTTTGVLHDTVSYAARGKALRFT